MTPTKDNVVVFRKGTTRFAIPEEVMNEIRLRLYDFDPKEAADFIGKSASCIYAIRSGRTLWPRGETFFKIMELLDLELHLYSTKEGRYI